MHVDSFKDTIWHDDAKKLIALGRHTKEYYQKIKAMQEDYKNLREEILGCMEELDLKTLTDGDTTISIAITDNFDAGWFVSPNNENAMMDWAQYVTSTKKITYKMDKKAVARLKKAHPDTYDLYCDKKERLTLK